MPPRLRLVLPYAVMLAAAAALWVVASRIDVDTGGRIGPAVWPKAILAVLAILCAYEIVKPLAAGSTASVTGIVAGLAAGDDEKAPSHPAKLAGGVALVAAYVLAVPWLGFFIATALFLSIFPWIGGYKRPLLIAAVGVAGSLALIVVFMRVAYISLPLGEGPFRALSIALLRALGVS